MASRQPFVAEQVASLEPLDFILVELPADPLAGIEIARNEDGSLGVAVATRPRPSPFTDEQRKVLADRGFVEGEEAWTTERRPPDPAAAAETVERLLVEVFHAEEPTAIDVTHGSRRPLRDAQRKLEALRARIEPILAAMLGHPPAQDPDGDYVFDYQSAQIYVAPMSVPEMAPVIRVFAITNVGVTVNPELGLLLARLNFTLLFGRFALDSDHRAVWFSETLLADQVSDEGIRFAVGMVAETADEWDERIAQMFGGYTRATIPHDEKQSAPTKPGRSSAADQAGYL